MAKDNNDDKEQRQQQQCTCGECENLTPEQQEERKLQNEKDLRDHVALLMSENLSPVELYKKIFDEGWSQGFSCGLDAEVEELHEQAHNLGELYLHALSDLMDAVEEKYKDPEPLDPKLSD